MDLNFFKQTRILDGGMGQELLARGMKPNGTLWSANAILDENYHQLLQDTHRDFIKAGAEVIVTTTFTTRRKRLRENNIEDKFEYLNIKAGEIAHKVKKEFPNVNFIEGLSFRNEKNLDIIKKKKPDYIISILFPYIFKKHIFDYVNIGILNLHPAFLPYTYELYQKSKNV